MLLQSLVGSPLGPDNIEGTTSTPQKTDVNLGVLGFQPETQRQNPARKRWKSISRPGASACGVVLCCTPKGQGGCQGAPLLSTQATTGSCAWGHQGLQPGIVGGK